MNNSIELLIFVSGIVLLTVYVTGRKSGRIPHHANRGSGRSTLAAGAYGAPSGAGAPGKQTPGATVPGAPTRRNPISRQDSTMS
jgi:hypothetical protein